MIVADINSNHKDRGLFMRKMQVVLSILLFLIILTGCNQKTDLTPGIEQQIKQAFLAYSGYDASYFDMPATSNGLTLSAEMEKAVKRAYVKYWGLDMPYFYVPNVNVVWCYDGMFAVYVGHLDIVSNETVRLPKRSGDGASAGYYVFETDTRSLNALYIYKDQKLCMLEEAYNAGWLTDAHLESLLEADAYLNREPYGNSAAQNLHLAWRSSNLYAFCVGSSPEWITQSIRLPKTGEDGTFAGYYDIEFRYSQQMYIYHNGVVSTLAQAYSSGIITTEHIDAMLKSGIIFSKLPHS